MSEHTGHDAPALPRPLVRILVSAFIVFHAGSIAVWSIPSQSKLGQVAKRAIGPYMTASGLWQGWDMFAPDPLALNASVDAEITFRDGTAWHWVFPRPETMGPVERYLKERYRKLRENVRLDAMHVAWPDIARYVARLHADTANPPVRVVLTRRWSTIPPPQPTQVGPRPDRVTLTSAFAFFTYEVRPEDFQPTSHPSGQKPSATAN